VFISFGEICAKVLDDEQGYYFYRDDYIKLKMLSFMVHKDVAEFLMPKFEGKENN
jgi:hypothetical protein